MRLLISGSPYPASANSRLLKSAAHIDTTNEYRLASYLPELPIFQPTRDVTPWPAEVVHFRQEVSAAQAVLIATPAYLDNIPGVLKNALDWLTSSGELFEKPVVAMSFCPAPPRGERALQSLLWSLCALDADVRLGTQLYQCEAAWDKDGALAQGTVWEELRAMLELL